jgi:hypothetical protein
MTVLRNRRREAFAVALAEGRCATVSGRLKAMEEAGFKPSEANARRLCNSKDIKERVHDLYKGHCEYISLDIVRVLIEQQRIAFANMVDYFEAGEDGKLQLKDLTGMPREMTAAIKRIRFDKEGRPLIELHDKAASLAALQRYLDPDPLPPHQRGDGKAPTPETPEDKPAYDRDDDLADLIQPQVMQ